MRSSFRPDTLLLLVVCFFASLVTCGCYTSSTAIPVTAATAPQPTSTPVFPVSSPTTLDPLCKWLLKANGLRANRISSAKSFADWIQKYGGEAAPEVGELALLELVDSLKAIQPGLEQFVQEWQTLEYPVEASSFWKQELRTNELRLTAVNEAIAAYGDGDADGFDNAMNKLVATAPSGREAERGFLALMERCGFF